MALSVYIHIPYCLQRCRYCDFTTFEFNQIMAPENYIGLVLKELRLRHQFVPSKKLRSVYFGGGTPSLISAELIISLLDELANLGFEFLPSCEVTLEINPATVDEKKLDLYLGRGVNRLSVGAQTFHDHHLRNCGRKHSAEDTRKTLDLLKRHKVNFSFDLLFALPGQSTAELESDLLEVGRYSPNHLSAYCLTVPEGHPMSSNRPLEEDQVEMFRLIECSLKATGLQKYEISNFAKPGFESKHNLAYWRDQSYWGLGLSAHSYFANQGPYGARFWNPKDFQAYAHQVETLASSLEKTLPGPQIEHLKAHEALSDFCHTHLRLRSGLPLEAVQRKFGPLARSLVEARLHSLKAKNLVQSSNGSAVLTQEGEVLSNLVFEMVHFSSAEEIAQPLSLT